MRVTIHQPQFLPWLGYLDKIDQSDLFIALDSVQFKKNEWQNRNRIRTADGCQWITVPVLHHFGQLVKDVRINQSVTWRQRVEGSLALPAGTVPRQVLIRLLEGDRLRASQTVGVSVGGTGGAGAPR